MTFIIVWPIFSHIYTETTINHLTSNNPFIWPCSFMYCVFRGQRSVRYCTAEVFFAFNDPCFASDLNLKPLPLLLLFCSPLLVLGLVWMQLLLTTMWFCPQTFLCVCVCLFGGIEKDATWMTWFCYDQCL